MYHGRVAHVRGLIVQSHGRSAHAQGYNAESPSSRVCCLGLSVVHIFGLFLGSRYVLSTDDPPPTSSPGPSRAGDLLLAPSTSAPSLDAVCLIVQEEIRAALAGIIPVSPATSLPASSAPLSGKLLPR